MIPGWLVAAAVLHAPAPPAGQISAARVAQLVRELDAPELARREAAETALLAMGPAVLAMLPPADSPAVPAEAKRRLARIVQLLEAGESAASLQPARVSAVGAPTLGEAVRRLVEQSGGAVAVPEAYRDLAVEPTLRDVPFWRALDELLDQTCLTVAPQRTPAGALLLAARPADERPRLDAADYPGPFRVEATRVQAARDLRRPSLHSLTLRLQIAWAPRLRPILVQMPAASLVGTVAIDTRDEPLRLDAAGVVAAATPAADRAWASLDVSLPAPSRRAARISVLRGRFAALVPAGRRRFAFGLDETGQPRRWGRALVTLETARITGGLLEVRVGLTMDRPSDAFQSHLAGWLLENEAYLTETGGKRIAPRDAAIAWRRDNGAGLVYRFAPPKDRQEAQFVFAAPTALVRQELAFRLRDIPLP